MRISDWSSDVCSSDLYVWAYQVRIENIGRETVQLRNRYWQITDAFGRVQEVRGPGVVGEQPVLQPGESFEYTSGTPLQTPSGIMVGTRSEEHTSELQSLMRIPYAVLCLKKKKKQKVIA